MQDNWTKGTKVQVGIDESLRTTAANKMEVVI